MTTKRTAIGDLLSDARAAGMEIIDEGIGYCIVAKRHARTGNVLRGIRIFCNNTAIDLTVDPTVDLTVDLTAAKAIRSTAAMRKVLRLEVAS